MMVFVTRATVLASVVLTLAISSTQATLVGSWNFEEAGGATVYDAVGTNHATIGAGAGSRVVTGDFGGNFGQSWSSVEGGAHILTDPYAGQYDALSSMSTEVWVKWDGSGVNNGWMSNHGFSQFIHTGVPGVRFIMGGVDSLYLPMHHVTANQWQQWVTTYDAGTGTMRVYANAVEVFSAGGGTGLAWNAALNDRWGLNGGGTYNDGTENPTIFNGLIDNISIHDVALTPAEILARYSTTTNVPPTTHYDRERSFVLSAWGTHRFVGGEFVDMDLFNGSGLNTFFDAVRSGSETSQHPHTLGLPSLLLATLGNKTDWPTADLQGFIDDFELARARQSNIIGVILGDELPHAGRNHMRAVRDWIVNNADPSIASMRTIYSDYYGSDWDGHHAAMQFDTGILQIYPFGTGGTYDAASHYTMLQWWSDWTKAKNVDMWVYTQNFMWDEAGRQSASELRLQRFVAFAYGATGLVDFLWNYNASNEWAYGGYATDGGVPSPNYPIVAPINEETKRLGSAMIRLNHISAHHRDDQAAGFWANRPAGWDLLDVTADNGNHLVIGYFLDDEGEQYWMVVNKDISKTISPEDLAAMVTMTFDPSVTGIQRLVRTDGSIENIDIVGGTYTFSLWGGTGDLFKFDTGAEFVPEPATLWLLLGAAALLRRRRGAGSKMA